MEFGVRGSPLLPQTSWGRAEAKNVKAPMSASFKGNISGVLGLLWSRKGDNFFMIDWPNINPAFSHLKTNIQLGKIIIKLNYKKVKV